MKPGEFQGKILEALINIKSDLEKIDQKLDHLDIRITKTEHDIIKIKTFGSVISVFFGVIGSFFSKLILK